jgi:hypothetical protein
MTSLFVSLVSRGPNCCQLQPSRPRSQCLFFKPSAHRHPSMPGMSQSKAQTCTCQREHTPGLQSDKVSIRAHYGVCTGVTYCIFDISGMTMHLACSLVLQMNGIGLGRVCDHEKTVLVAIQCYSISLQNFRTTQAVHPFIFSSSLDTGIAMFIRVELCAVVQQAAPLRSPR